ncbi:DUF4352 domain-containing protein [Candidatus Saccharibacteria bacterium]|nr:DUF4352 domain-containing protein [Candidatus Saccharibacteria bacterium]
MFRKKRETPIEIVEDEVKELKKEYKRFAKFRDENSLLMTVFVLGITALVIINTLFWMKWAAEHPSSTPGVTKFVTSSVVKSLDMARNNSLSAQVKNVTTNSNADPAFGVPDDQTMLIMDLTVTNTSKIKQQFIPVSQLYVRTRDGDYSILHASMHVKNPIAARDLMPGESVSGQVSFAVSKRADTPLLYIDTGWDKTTPLVIDALH